MTIKNKLKSIVEFIIKAPVMIMFGDIEPTPERYVTCPKCGKDDIPSWEWSKKKCDYCGKVFVC